MTRVNVIPVSELSDQWLIAEYRELPRCIKQDIDTSDGIYMTYCLCKGHVKWAKTHSFYLFDRYADICEEMRYRGFEVNYPAYKLEEDYYGYTLVKNNHNYIPTAEAIIINRKRLIEKYKMKPDFYKWTKRNKPEWITKGEKK